MNGKPQVTQEMIDLYDEYTHLTLDRRGFMEKLTALAGSAAAAAAIVPLIAPSRAAAALVPAEDPRLRIEHVAFPAPSGEVIAYLARPAEAAGRLPAVLVIHENRGLNPHIEDVTRRMALEGFLALGVDFMSPLGGTPADEQVAAQRFRELDREAALGIGLAAVAFLKSHPLGNGKVGAVGFCWGGGMVNQLAVNSTALDAGVAYYGAQPDATAVPKITARMMLHYGGLDERINAGIPAYRAALEAAGIDHQIFVYEGANHAFHNDTSGARYSKEASDLAWSRTVGLFRETLG
ncbi:MAG: dienelactone hydrolase family protein [Bauldia sp.]|nr:dienelactone hydrolase family protein [Bauldia sp.]